jgi:LuxR family quorum-sensing system transcriptional regulator CciR
VQALLFANELSNLISSAKSFDELNEALGIASNELGFQLYALTQHPRPTDRSMRPIRLHNYAPEWQEVYDRRRLGLCDPVHRVSRRIGDGFRWRDVRDLIDLRDDDEWMLEQGRQHDIADGYTIPVNILGEPSGSVTFAIRTGRPFPEEMLLVAFSLGAKAYHRARVIQGIVRPPRRRLVTDRHAQVLKWLGCNKTDAETGLILGISGTTVTKHVRDICTRFDVDKRTVLPLRAVYEGILCFEDFDF